MKEPKEPCANCEHWDSFKLDLNSGVKKRIICVECPDCGRVVEIKVKQIAGGRNGA